MTPVLGNYRCLDLRLEGMLRLRGTILFKIITRMKLPCSFQVIGGLQLQLSGHLELI